MAPFISTTVQRVILPMIMLAIVAFARIIASLAPTPELKVSSWAGIANERYDSQAVAVS